MKLAVFISAGFASTCSAQLARFPTGWSEARPPAEEIREGNSLACANYSHHEWKVISGADGLQVVDDAEKVREAPVLPSHLALSKDMRGRVVTLRISDGWLLGFDAGEFGGGLWWSSANGRITKRLLDDNVHALVARDGVALVLTGLAHMGFDQGAIYAYHPSKTEAPGNLLRVADLGSSPGAASVGSDGTLFVVTQKRILRFGPNGDLEPLYASGALSALHPNSIALQKDGRLFVGMRFYVLELVPGANHLRSARWFITSVCKRATIKDFDCVCTGEHGN